jgi:hypothetical protein
MASSPKLPIPFEPVRLRRRHDGWTVERQIAFIEKLADCGSVSSACKHVGMSRESARKLRRHRFGPEADSLPRPPSIPGYDPDEPIPFDPEGELDGCLDALEFAPEPPPEDGDEDEPWRTDPNQP